MPSRASDLNDLQHFAYQLRIQRRGRFVKQHDVRLERQRPGDRHALLLAAGELSGVLVGMGQQADAVEQRQGLLAGDRLVQQLVIARGQHHVVEHRAVGEQVEALEDHADAPYPGAHLAFVDDGSALKIVLAVENDLPAIKAFEGVDGADQGGFAGAGRADDADHLPVLHLQIDAFQHLMLPQDLRMPRRSSAGGAPLTAGVLLSSLSAGRLWRSAWHSASLRVCGRLR